jgi:serine/threonine protein kinase
LNVATQRPADLVGRVVLGRYRIVRAIGRGGMGVIYLARSEGAAGFVKPFVIKQAAPEIMAQGQTMIEQLAREARIMSNLRHPGIVSVIDFAEDDGSYLLVLDYVQGYNLGQWRKYVQHAGRPFSTEFALHVVERVLDALDYAHTLTRSDGGPLEIVHRDVSPGNVLLDIEGRVKLADFGVARMGEDRTEASDGRMIKGKISYMAPELFAHAPPSAGSDVYACAVMLHELLVGRNEFKAENVHMTAMRVMQHVPSVVSSVRNDVPAGLDRVLQKALAKSSADRFDSARELAEALNRLRTVPPETTARRLTTVVREDFNDPRMSDFLGVDDPTTLERAWRESSVTPNTEVLPHNLSQTGGRRSALPAPRSIASRSTLPPPAASAAQDVAMVVEEIAVPQAAPIPSVPTVAAAPVALGVKQPTSHSWSIALGLGGLVAGACALVIVVLRLRAAPDAPERVIVVDSHAGAAAVAPTASTPAKVEPPVVPVAATVEPPKAGGPTSAALAGAAPASVGAAPAADGSAQALTRVIARRQDQIAGCFSKSAADVSGTPGLSLRFEIDASGHVVSAHVLPPALAATPLGQCIETVAQGTDFGPQPHPVSFRIPLTARRTQ